MEGGKTRLTCLCCTLSPCRGSLDASPSVGFTAETFRHGERPWGWLGETKDGGKKEGKRAFGNGKRGYFQTLISDAWKEPIESEKIRQGAWNPLEGVFQSVGKGCRAEKGGLSQQGVVFLLKTRLCSKTGDVNTCLQAGLR